MASSMCNMLTPIFIPIPRMDLRIQTQRDEASDSTGLAILEYRLAVNDTATV